MVRIIENFSAGSVATVNDDGTPAVSPKATFAVVDQRRLVFGDLRSPSTIANLRARPSVEVVFIDVLNRKAVRVAGTATVLPAAGELRAALEVAYRPYVELMDHVVEIAVDRAEVVTSPAYDIGLGADELRRTNLAKLTDLASNVDCSEPSTAVNELGQTIGRPVQQPKLEPPARVALVGTHCRVEPLDPERHGRQLHQAYAAATDDSDWTYLPYGPWPDRAPFLAWLESVEPSTDPMFFAIVERDGETCSGLASYLRVDPTAASIEVGHIHFARRLQQTAAATEAMFLMMAHVFDAGYRRYEWKCDDLNDPSQVAARRFGFHYEGTFRQATHYKGRNRDTAWYSIVDGEWPTLKRGYERWLDPDNFDDHGAQRSPLRFD